MNFSIASLISGPGRWKCKWSTSDDRRNGKTKWFIHDESSDTIIADFSWRDDFDDPEQIMSDAWLLTHAPDLFHALNLLVKDQSKENIEDAVRLIKVIEAGYQEEEQDGDY